MKYLSFIFILFFILLNNQTIAQELEYDDMYFTKKDREKRKKKKEEIEKKEKEKYELLQKEEMEKRENSSFDRGDDQYFHWIDDDLSYQQNPNTSFNIPISDLDHIDPTTGQLIPYDPYYMPGFDPISEAYGYQASYLNMGNGIYAPNPLYNATNFPFTTNTNPTHTESVRPVSQSKKRVTPIKRNSSNIVRKPNNYNSSRPSYTPRKTAPSRSYTPSKNNNSSSPSKPSSGKTYSRKSPRR